MFTKLPFDVFFEIFGYLPPICLLNVSYTSKTMRFWLTHDHMNSVWKKAYTTNLQPNYFRGVKYPPACPPSVDIRHYTSVLFGETCLFCAGPGATCVHWGALTRLCDACASIHLINTYSLDNETYEISKLCWFSIAELPVAPPRQIYVPHVPNHVEERSIDNQVLKEDLELECRRIRNCVNDAARRSYEAKRFAIRRDLITNHSIGELQKWGQVALREKNASLGERAQWIRDRLSHEGYTDLAYSWKWLYKNNEKDFPMIQTPLPLNDDGWDIIKATYRPIFELERQQKRQRKMVDVYKKRFSFINDLMKIALGNQPKPWIYPPLSTLAKLKRIKSFIKAIERNSNEGTIEMILAAAVAPRIPKFLTAWRAEADAYPVHLLAEHPTTKKAAASRNTLNLATTFFKCDFCTDPISYPRILMHQCLRTRRKILDGADGRDDEALVNASELEPNKKYGVTTVTEEGVWNRMSMWSTPTWNDARHFISVDEAAVKSAKAIARTCGEDPDTVLTEVMKSRDVRLECNRCGPKSNGKRHIMSWNMAILHDVSVHPYNISSRSWRLVTSSSDLALVKTHEAKFLQRKGGKSYERCRHCDAIVQTPSDAIRHLDRKHEITVSTDLHEHVYMQLDVPMKAYSCVVRI
ncbi:hypothetical protein BDN70DRAFT_197531 [Pholiota conissans]|uniref:F-box domain-containing protein n=1 Tax=Pholiota conissans TaxID=109636 RepID=A0A9P5ZBH5_9AGAR|nr:hypothetical protein BDN70DRAFT_197531 [Pholiota conissans]